MIDLSLRDTSFFKPYFAAPCEPGGSFFGLPTWYKYLPGETDAYDKCVPTIDSQYIDGFNAFWPIVLAIADMIIMLSGMIAVILIVIAGISFVTSQGEPDKVAQARQRIITALVGLGIIVIAAVTVNFIGNNLLN